jgi:hypothetical protein
MINLEKPHNVWTANFNSVEARGTQQLRAITCLSVDGSDNSLWEEVKFPGVENFERVRINLQTPKCLKLGPLLVATVDALPFGLQDLQSIDKLDPSPDQAVDQEDTHGSSWLVTMFHDWNFIIENFASVSWELHERGLGARDYKIAVNKAISKLQSGLEETNTKIQLVVAMLGNPPMSLSVGGSLTIGDSLGQIGFDVARLKKRAWMVVYKEWRIWSKARITPPVNCVTWLWASTILQKAIQPTSKPSRASLWHWNRALRVLEQMDPAIKMLAEETFAGTT